MCVNRPLLESLLPPGITIGGIGDRIGAVDYSPVHKALLLPDNCRITGVSVGARFQYDEVALRIECPDFIETPEACVLPEVMAMLSTDDMGTKFVGWSGAAVGEQPPAQLPVTEGW